MRKAVLKLRYFLGWGHEPEELSVLGHIMADGSNALALCGFLGSAGIPAVTFVESHGHFTAAAVTAALKSCVAALLLAALLLALGIRQQRLAARAAASGISTVYCQCFEVISDAPLRLFARIGLTPDAARWYRLPVEWDAVIVPSSDQLEIEAYAVTGYVTRLRRSGSRPSELSVEAFAAAQSEGIPTIRRPTRDMRRYLRMMWWKGLGYSSGETLREGVSIVLLAVLFGGLCAFGLLLPVFGVPTTPDQYLLAAYLFVPGVGVGLALGVWGVVLIRAGRHASIAATRPSVIAEGVIAEAFVRRLGNRPSMVVSLRRNDGSDRVLWIPPRFAHRVPPGAHVRIEYQPVSEHVVNVTRLDPVPGTVSLQG